jgi:hypothetical protein
MAHNIMKIFQELFHYHFPINSIKPMEEFNGNDELSMEHNNSSCFNFRPILGTNKLSTHSYGLAIDINPLQNPYIVTNNQGAEAIYPANGTNYLDRSIIIPGMVEPVIEIFAKYGFNIWGGNWHTPKDYQHFQATPNVIENIISQL